MAYTLIDDPSAYFQTKLYTGTGSELVLTNDGNSDLQPDFLWIKNRTDASTNHHAHNTNVASTQTLFVNKTDYEETQSQSVKSIQSDGFTLGTWGGNNLSSKNFVAWQWKANGGTTASNTDGTITSTVQANTDAGFSIITYTGTGGGETFGHGLGVAPDMWIVKRRSSTGSWAVGFNDADILGGTSKYLILQGTGATSTYSNFWGSSPASSTVMRIAGDATIGGSGSTYVAYAFAAKQGYSKFGKYIGNGSTDGTFVYTGFKPAFILFKKSSDSGDNWMMYDHKRPGFNVTDEALHPNSDAVEYDNANANLDILSNGFKLRSSFGWVNQNTHTYIYMAFAENPFVTSTGIMGTAR